MDINTSPTFHTALVLFLQCCETPVFSTHRRCWRTEEAKTFIFNAKMRRQKSQFSAMPPLFLTLSPLMGHRLTWWVWTWLWSISCSYFRSLMGLQQPGTWSKRSQRFPEINPRVHMYNCTCQCCGGSDGCLKDVLVLYWKARVLQKLFLELSLFNH